MEKRIMVNVILESGDAFLIPWLQDRDKESEMIQVIINSDYPGDSEASRTLTVRTYPQCCFTPNHHVQCPNF